MNDYYHIRFDLTPCTEAECDILSALLCDAGFESFVPDEAGVSAYIKKELYSPEIVSDALASYEFNAAIQVKEELIPGQDWTRYSI